MASIELFTAVGAIAKAIFVVPGLPREWLAGSPFNDYTVPALALGILAAGAAMAISEVAAVGFMIVTVPTEPASYLQPFYFIIGVVIAGLGVLVWHDADASEPTLQPSPAQRGAV